MITQAKNAEEVLLLIKQAPKDTTVFLDIDDTIIAPVSSSFRLGLNNIIDDMKAHHEDYENFDEILSNWRLQRKVLLIDNKWPEVINILKESHPVYALTAMNTGRFGAVDLVEKWREEELRSLGIIFTQNLAAQSLKIDAEYAMIPVFYGGILLTGAASKSETIKLFNSVLTVKSLVLVDDRTDYLRSVEAFCIKEDIKYLGIHFTGAQDIPGVYNDKIAQFQKQYLIEHGKWLEDDEALKLINLSSNSK